MLDPSGFALEPPNRNVVVDAWGLLADGTPRARAYLLPIGARPRTDPPPIRRPPLPCPVSCVDLHLSSCMGSRQLVDSTARPAVAASNKYLCSYVRRKIKQLIQPSVCRHRRLFFWVPTYPIEVSNNTWAVYFYLR